MAGLEMMCKGKVHYGPLSIQSDLQLICSDAASADGELVEVVWNDSQGGYEIRQGTGQIHCKVFDVEELISDDSSGFCRLHATRCAQLLDDVGQPGFAGYDE